MLVGHLLCQAWVFVPAETAVCAGELCPEDMGTSFLGAYPAPGLFPEETTKPEWLSPAPSHPDFVASPSMQWACACLALSMG